MDEGKENKFAHKRTPKQKKEDVCGRCGKTPNSQSKSTNKRNTPYCHHGKSPVTMEPLQSNHGNHDNTPGQPLSISLIKIGNSAKKGKRKRCKHKEELAKYTNVSATTTACSVNSSSVAESASDSEQSCASTLTQITHRSVRSMKRENDAKKEIARLNSVNEQLSDHLELLSNGASVRELYKNLKTPSKIPFEETAQVVDDNTLTPGGHPADLSLETQNSFKSTPQASTRISATPRDTARSSATPRDTRRDTPNSVRSRGFTPQVADMTFLETVHEVKTPLSQMSQVDSGVDSAYQMSKIDSGYQTQTSLRASKELLTELEEENEVLRAELKGSISNSKHMLALEKEMRQLGAENSRCKQEIARLENVDYKLRQVEEFYHEEKKTFRCTIEDTLLTFEDLRKDKEEVEVELEGLKENIKDTEDRNTHMKEELEEQNTLLANNVEKLKLELDTGRAENGMLHSRITTVEENCCFLEGQVKALEKDGSEKTQIIVAAEQHARDLEMEIGEFRREKTALEMENLKIKQQDLHIENLNVVIKSLESEKSELKTNSENTSVEIAKLQVRLSELIKSRTSLEEALEEKNRNVLSLQSEVETVKNNTDIVSTNFKEVDEERVKLRQENAEQFEEEQKLSRQLELLRREIKYIEQAFFKGWSEEEETSVTFEDETVTHQFPQANKIIQTIKLDRQKLKAKLVRSVQDNKLIKSQVEEVQETFEQENGSLARQLRGALERLEESDTKTHVFERKTKNQTIQIEELTVVNQSLEQENYHLKKLSDSLKST